jgi:hypothetical protein
LQKSRRPWKDVSGKKSTRPPFIGSLNDRGGGKWFPDRSMSMPTRRNKRLLKKIPEIIAEKLEERDPEDNRPVLLFAQDEGRFGRISDVRRAWSPLGTRPQAPRQVIRSYLYVFTAVCPALGKMTSLILPWANTEMMNIFLRQVAEDFSDYFILMLTDQAG